MFVRILELREKVVEVNTSNPDDALEKVKNMYCHYGQPVPKNVISAIAITKGNDVEHIMSVYGRENKNDR